jgi:predicted permease
MSSALQVFLNPVLPIFAVLGVGMLLMRRGVFDASAASILNRFVFYIGAPALLFSLLTSAPLATFEWQVLLLYFTSEMAIYAAGTALARYVFRREWREAMLLGMTACFVNHVFFVLPMARVLYGDAASAPIAAIIVVDTVLIFALTIVALELSSPAEHSGRLLVAAGPCGAMPFVLALQYKINVTTIARAIGYSTLVSLITLAVMA